jgi:hypothetical protein
VSAPRLFVLADDLIWATRIEGQGRTLGAFVERHSTLDGLTAALAGSTAAPHDLVAIDATSRSYAPADAVARATAAGWRVLALVQHDDPTTRTALIAAGAARAMPYRALFERGHAILAEMLDLPVPPVAGSRVPEAE